MNVAKFTAVALLALGLFQNAYGADQVDNEARAKSPSLRMVRVNEQTGKAEIFEVKDAPAAKITDKTSKEDLSNLVAKVEATGKILKSGDSEKILNELNRESSKEACFGYCIPLCYQACNYFRPYFYSYWYSYSFWYGWW